MLESKSVRTSGLPLPLMRSKEAGEIIIIGFCERERPKHYHEQRLEHWLDQGRNWFLVKSLVRKLHRDFWQIGERNLQRLFRIREVLQFSCEILVIGRHVEMAVSRKIEKQRLRFAGLLAT